MGRGGRYVSCVAILICACARVEQRTARPSPPSLVQIVPPVPLLPLPVVVSAVVKREHSVLRVEVAGVARGHAAAEALEIPTKWQVDAFVQGQALKRLVVTPGRVERWQASEDTWDVTVSFRVYFQAPEAEGRAPLRLVVMAPGDPREHTFDTEIALAIPEERD